MCLPGSGDCKEPPQRLPPTPPPPGLKCFKETGSVLRRHRGGAGWGAGATNHGILTMPGFFRSPGKCDGGSTGIANREGCKDPTLLIHWVQFGEGLLPK